MLKEIETEHGSIVLDAGWEDAVDYLMEAELVRLRVKRFDLSIRAAVRELVYKVIEEIVIEYNLDEIVQEDDSFWEWFAEQQED